MFKFQTSVTWPFTYIDIAHTKTNHQSYPVSIQLRCKQFVRESFQIVQSGGVECSLSLSGVKLSARPLEVDNGNYLQQEIWGLLCDELCS